MIEISFNQENTWQREVMTEVSCDRERGAREGEKEAGKEEEEEEAGCKTEKHIRLKEAENKRRNQFWIISSDGCLVVQVHQSARIIFGLLDL